jgi:hypothetical protein
MVLIHKLAPQLLWPILLLVGGRSFSQVHGGLNLGPAYGRTIDAGLRVYIPDEDWISLHAEGGYTFEGPLYFPRKQADCLSDAYHAGYHFRVGFRNGITTDYRKSHLFWGAELTFVQHRESALLQSCQSDPQAPYRDQHSLRAWAGGFSLGYTWNPLQGKSYRQPVFLDFGLRVSHPFHFSHPPFGNRGYYSGIGYTYFPIRQVAIEPVFVLRWELWQDKKGYNRPRTVKRFKQSK